MIFVDASQSIIHPLSIQNVLFKKDALVEDMITTMNNIQMKPVNVLQKEIPIQGKLESFDVFKETPSLSNGLIRTSNQFLNPMSATKSPESKLVNNTNLGPLFEINSFIKETPIQRQESLHQIRNQNLFRQNNAQRPGAGTNSNTNLRPLFEINPFMKETPIQVRQGSFAQSCNQTSFGQNDVKKLGAGITNSMNNSNPRPLFEINPFIKENPVQERQKICPLFKDTALPSSIRNNCSQNFFQQNNVARLRAEANSVNNCNLRSLFEINPFIKERHMQAGPDVGQDTFPQRRNASSQSDLANSSKLNAFWQNSVNRFGPEKTSPSNSNLKPLLEVYTSKRETKKEIEHENLHQSKPNISFSTGETRASSAKQNLVPANITENPGSDKSLAILISSDSSASNGQKRKEDNQQDNGPRRKRARRKNRMRGIPKNARKKLKIKNMLAKKQLPSSSASAVSKSTTLPVTSPAVAATVGMVDAVSKKRETCNKPTVPAVCHKPTFAVASSVKEETVATDMEQKERIIFHKPTVPVVSSVTTVASTPTTVDMEQKERMISNTPTVPVVSSATTVASTPSVPTTADTETKDRKICSKSTVSLATEQHCKVCNKAYKLKNHCNKEGAVISDHLFEVRHLENALALHDPWLFGRNQRNLSSGLESTKNKMRTLARHHYSLVNSVKEVERRFIRNGQITPDEVKTHVLNANKATAHYVYCKLCKSDFGLKPTACQKHMGSNSHLIRTLEEHRPGLARKLCYEIEFQSAHCPKLLKRNRFFTAIRDALKMVKSDFERRNLPVPREIPNLKDNNEEKWHGHDVSQSDDLQFQWIQEDPIKDVDELFSDMHATFEKLNAYKAQNSNLDLADNLSSREYPFCGLLHRREFTCFLDKDELIKAILEKRKKTQEVTENDSLSMDVESLRSTKIRESTPAQVNGSEMSQGSESHTQPTQKNSSASQHTDPGSKACCKDEKLLHHSSISVSEKETYPGTQTITKPQQKSNAKEGLLPTPTQPLGSIQRMDLHKRKELLPRPTNSFLDEKYFRRKEGCLLPIPTENVSDDNYLQSAENNVHCSETYTRVETLQQKAVEVHRKGVHTQDLTEQTNSNTIEKGCETDKICTQQKEVSYQETGAQQCVKDKGTNATTTIFLPKLKFAKQETFMQHIGENDQNVEGETFLSKQSIVPREEELDGAAVNGELQRTNSTKKEKEIIQMEIESSDESIDDWKEIPLQRNSIRKHHNAEIFDHGRVEKADERENQMCPENVNNFQFNSSIDKNSNSSYQHQASRADRPSRCYDLSAKREALLTTLNSLKTCLITNEEEADMAWQISYSLTEALLQYRRGQKPNS